MDEVSREISRREALKRGAAVGVGVLWATPAVQAVSMMRSAAAATSPPPEDPVYYAVKIDGGGCDDIWDQVGRDENPNAPRGKCLTPNAGGLAVVPGGCRKVDDFDNADGDEWMVKLAAGCVILTDSAWIKAGRECVRASVRSEGRRYYISIADDDNDMDISNVQFIICCESDED